MHRFIVELFVSPNSIIRATLPRQIIRAPLTRISFKLVRKISLMVTLIVQSTTLYAKSSICCYGFKNISLFIVMQNRQLKRINLYFWRSFHFLYPFSILCGLLLFATAGTRMVMCKIGWQS